MLPFPIINQYGSVVPPENTIISFLKKGGSLTEANITISPNEFYTASYNAIKFGSSNSNIQVGTGGVPSIWQIGDSTNFKFETYIKLTDTNTKILCGNLNNSGTGSYWLVLNNTYQSSAAVALDGFSTTGSVQRFHFTSMKTLTINAWHHIELERVGTNLTCTIDGVVIGTQTMSLGFKNHTNAFRVGDSTDNAYPFNAILDSFKITTS